MIRGKEFTFLVKALVNELNDCKCNGASFTGSTFKQTRLTSSSFVYALISETLFEGCCLTDTDLSKSSMSQVVLRKTVFQKCRLVNTELFRTPLKGIDLSDCDISGITLSETLAELKGATVSYSFDDLGVSTTYVTTSKK